LNISFYSILEKKEMQPSRGSTQTKNAEASFSQPVGGNFVFIFIMRRINIL
jgi:hypothetical protein